MIGQDLSQACMKIEAINNITLQQILKIPSHISRVDYNYTILISRRSKVEIKVFGSAHKSYLNNYS